MSDTDRYPGRRRRPPGVMAALDALGQHATRYHTRGQISWSQFRAVLDYCRRIKRILDNRNKPKRR